MSTPTSDSLAQKRCKPCEGGVQPIPADAAATYLQATPEWRLCDEGRAIERKWTMKNFVQAMQFLQQVGEVAEAEQHHPDLHLTGYRKVRIELTTHAIGGLSENDFILAAKIDQLRATAT